MPDQPTPGASPRSTAILVAAALAGLGLLAASRPLWAPSPPGGAALDDAIAGLAVADPLLVGRPIEINAAAASELDTLPGIGPVLAERIVAEREQNGPYRDAADLAERVAGVGDALAEALAGHVRFEP